MIILVFKHNYLYSFTKVLFLFNSPVKDAAIISSIPFVLGNINVVFTYDVNTT